MSEPFIGEIRMFAGNFAPRGWAFCDGQLLAVNQNDALFSLLGTVYGGDGRTTFGLPECRGRVPVGQGQGPGLSNRPLGQKAGQETVTLITQNIPQHNHGGSLIARGVDGTTTTSADNMYAKGAAAPAAMYHPGQGRASSPTFMNANALRQIGGSQPHSNMAESLTVNFIIALFGIYPSRT